MYFEDNYIQIFNQDFRTNGLPDESVQCVATSPPYWGLRKYAGEQNLIWGGDNHHAHNWQIEKIESEIRTGLGLAEFSEQYRGGGHKAGEVNRIKTERGFCSICGAWKGQFGLEPTPELYVQHTIEILREIKRVLRKDGVVFWNIGDSYYASGNGYGGDHGKAVFSDSDIEKPRNTKHKVIKPKDLCLIPFRVAIAAQEDGWFVRSIIIWSKKNPMPESVKDRPTDSHEYIIMLTKSAKYYWDQEAVREKYTEPLNRWGGESLQRDTSKTAEYKEMQQIGYSSAFRVGRPMRPDENGRNIRSVWEFPTIPYPGAHFAVFPEKLPELCIKAATPEMGSCAKCGKPWTRVLEQGFTDHNGETEGGKDDNSNRIAKLRQAAREQGFEYSNNTKTIGWKPTCKCNTIKPPAPALVLDPFMGSGTTLWVAKKLWRKAVGFDIAEDYCKLAVERNRQAALSLANDLGSK